MLRFRIILVSGVALAGIVSLYGGNNNHPRGHGEGEEVSIDSAAPADSFTNYDVMPEPIKLVKPKYPVAALKAGIEGTVMVHVRLDTNGVVSEAKIWKASGSKVGLEEAALKAARRTRWKPALVLGKKTVVWVAYQVKFTLPEEADFPLTKFEESVTLYVHG